MRNRITMLLIPLLAGCSSAGGDSGPMQVVRTDQNSGTTALLIAVSPVNENVVWASGAQGTWLRSINGGATWQSGRVPGADSLQFRDVHAFDANNAFLLSIGNGAQSRIYKTSNAGESWTLQFTNPEQDGFYDCFSFWDPQRGLVIGDAVGGEMRMLTTSNGGATWTRVSGLPPAQPSEGSFAASGTCLITRPGGHAWVVASNANHGRTFHTADYGRSWTVDTLPITTRSASGPQSIAFRDNRNGIALGGGNAATPTDVLAAITNDGGNTWTPRARPPMATGVWGGVYVPGSRIVVAVGPAGAVYSLDDAATWIPIDSNNYWSLGFASRRAGWLVGQRGRITKIELR